MKMATMNRQTDGAKINNNMGLQNLLNEPHRLTSESKKLDVELDSLVLDNYRIFIENLTCSVLLRSEDKTLSDVSEELDNHIKDLSHQCTSFKDRVSSFVTNHKRNRKTLQHHLSLVELLEVPQLVDACARNGFHDEALELANFVNGLERRHLLATEVKSVGGKMRAGSGVVQSIVSDVHDILVTLRQQLLQQCAESISLPKQIQTLSTLRKLDRMLIDRRLSVGQTGSLDPRFIEAGKEGARQQLVARSEVRLQMDFLEARTVWLDRAVEAARAGAHSTSESLSESKKYAGDGSSSSSAGGGQLGPYGRVIEMLESRRTSWFAVITQFAALFQVDMAVTPAASPLGLGDHEYSAHAVLTGWATRQVHALLSEMRELLPQIKEGGSLRSVLEQTLFFSHRMGQVRCDFTELVLPLFKEVVTDRVSKELRAACENFQFICQNERILFDSDGRRAAATNTGGPSVTEQLIPLFSDQSFAELRQAAGDGTAPTPQAPMEVPSSLMRFPPLAYLLNCLSSTFNFLRECPMAAAREDVRAALFSLCGDLSAFLETGAAGIRTAGAKYLVGEARRSEDTVRSMDVRYAQALAFDLFPYALLCLEAVFTASPAKLLDRVRNYKLKHSKGPGVEGAELNEHAPLVSTASQGQELLGKGVFARLNDCCWSQLGDTLAVVPGK